MNLGDLPAPFSNSLTVYVIGPGFGESQVISFPDGRWAVVDCCRHEGACAPLALLNHFDVDTIDLLVLTHPDQDHIGGLKELVERVQSIHKIWCYPQSNLLKPLLARLLRQRGDDGRLKHIAEAAKLIDQFRENNEGSEVGYGHRSWPGVDSEYQLHLLAPTQHDRMAAFRGLMNLVDNVEGQPELASDLVDYVTGERRRWSEDTNGVSLALTIEWAGRKLLLSGDVDNGSAHPASGWSGILKVLEADGLQHRVRDLDLVKVAHHGSKTAFWYGAWKAHSESKKVPHALVTPFTRGSENPPHQETLTKLKDYVDRLILTSPEGDGVTRAQAVGWAPEAVTYIGNCELPLAMLCFPEDGSCPTPYLSDVAQTFQVEDA